MLEKAYDVFCQTIKHGYLSSELFPRLPIRSSGIKGGTQGQGLFVNPAPQDLQCPINLLHFSLTQFFDWTILLTQFCILGSIANVRGLKTPLRV